MPNSTVTLVIIIGCILIIALCVLWCWYMDKRAFGGSIQLPEVVIVNMQQPGRHRLHEEHDSSSDDSE